MCSTNSSFLKELKTWKEKNGLYSDLKLRSTKARTSIGRNYFLLHINGHQQFGVGLNGKMLWGIEILRWDSFLPTLSQGTVSIVGKHFKRDVKM